jgi:hypothetical protein
MESKVGCLVAIGGKLEGLRFFGFALLSGNELLAGEPATNNPAQTGKHDWAYIQYPWNLPNCPAFLIGWPSDPVPGIPSEVSRGLRLDVMNISQGLAFFKTNAISARLYRADGQILEPTVEGKKLLNAPLAASTGFGEEPNPQVLTYFPWGPNVLQESWIEVTIAPERYWLEVPYGFDRNPADSLASANANGPRALLRK